MKRSITFSFCLLFGIITVYSQPLNLAFNGDFEILSGNPTGPGYLALASRWSNGNGQTSFPFGTPDLFTFGGSGGAQWPNSYAGTIIPQSGDALAGFITSNFFVPDFREYSIYHLDAAMTPGQSYTVSFWLSNGTGNWYGSRGSNNIGAAFTMASPVQIQHEPLAIIPQFELTSIIHHTSWQQYTFTFTPAQPFQWLTIGNFRSDLLTSYATITTGNPVAFYFLDDITVFPSVPLAAEELRLAQSSSETEMDLTWHLPEDAAGDQLSLERSLDQNSFVRVEQFKEIDNPGTDVQFVDGSALPGLQYYYRLRDMTANGELKFSPVIAATFGNPGKYVAGSIYPNPVRSHFRLDFTALVDGELEISLLDGTGRMVFETTTPMKVSEANPSYTLPEGLAAGVYQARFSFADQNFTQKLVVVGVQ